MTISLKDAGKRFRLDWIFRGLDAELEAGQRIAVLGPNGSGKSTLLKVLSGHLSLSRGKIQHLSGDRPIDPDLIYQQVSYAAPYIELIEELTLEEAIRFHTSLKPLLPGMSVQELYALLELPKARHKEIRFFSSGMKQRVKLALAICSDTPLLMLDEPTTNLDVQATAWYQQMVDRYSRDRLLIIASNDPSDLELCTRKINILDYKKR